jgi:hypothetical protein
MSQEQYVVMYEVCRSNVSGIQVQMVQNSNKLSIIVQKSYFYQLLQAFLFISN